MPEPRTKGSLSRSVVATGIFLSAVLTLPVLAAGASVESMAPSAQVALELVCELEGSSQISSPLGEVTGPFAIDGLLVASTYLPLLLESDLGCYLREIEVPDGPGRIGPQDAAVWSKNLPHVVSDIGGP